MKTASTYPLSISAPNKLFVRLVGFIIKLLYNTDIQVITPPLINTGQKWLTGIIRMFVGWAHDHTHTLLFRKQFVRCCTTKYIFWLGKNKFDRDGPSVNITEGYLFHNLFLIRTNPT
jgi:hypothetical protein